MTHSIFLPHKLTSGILENAVWEWTLAVSARGTESTCQNTVLFPNQSSWALGPHLVVLGSQQWCLTIWWTPYPRHREQPGQPHNCEEQFAFIFKVFNFGLSELYKVLKKGSNSVIWFLDYSSLWILKNTTTTYFMCSFASKELSGFSNKDWNKTVKKKYETTG